MFEKLDSPGYSKKVKNTNTKMFLLLKLEVLEKSNLVFK